MTQRTLGTVFLLAFLAANAGGASFYLAYPAPNVWTLYLDGKELNGAFDTIYVKTSISAPSTFSNVTSGLVAGVPRPPGQPFSYLNRMLDADPTDIAGGLGLTRFGVVNTPQELAFAAAALDGAITTADQPGGRLFLANFFREHGSFGSHVQLLREGKLLFEANVIPSLTPPEFPEPSSLILMGLGVLVVGVARQRR